MHLGQSLFAQEVHYFVNRVCSHFIKSAVTLGLTDLLKEFINFHGGPGELEVLDSVLEYCLAQATVTSGPFCLFKVLKNGTRTDKAGFLEILNFSVLNFWEYLGSYNLSSTSQCRGAIHAKGRKAF